MRFSSLKFRGLLLVGAMCFALAAELSVRSAVNWLLMHEAEVTAMDWAHHIQRNIPSPANGVSYAPQEFAAAAAQFETILNESVTVGSVFSADFINLHCLCSLSAGTYDPSVVGNLHHSTHGHSSRSEIHDGAQHSGVSGTLALSHKSHDNAAHHSDRQTKPITDQAKMAFNDYPQKFVRQVFNNRDNQQQSAEPMRSSFPLDKALLARLAEEDAFKIRIHHHVAGNNPHVLGEFYHPMVVDGQTNHYLRFLINLDAPAARLPQFLYLSGLVLLVLFGTAFYYPVRKLFQATKQERLASERVHFLANKDSLTKLGNRNALQAIVSDMIEQCERENKSFGVMLIDVNNFKEINDFYGYKAGDQALIHVASALQKHAPEGSFIARTGGDEFAIFADFDNLDRDVLSQKISEESVFVFELDDDSYEIDLSLSKGFARYPDHGDTLSALMQNVDLAMHAAKDEGVAHVVTFNTAMANQFHSRVAMFKEFRSAIESSAIIPYYQPLIDLETGELIGFEALARWNHPEKGVITPIIFHEAIEDREINALLGAEMLKLIAQDMGRWKKRNIAFESVGFNVGEGDLLRPGFVLDVANTISKNGLIPKELAVEVTENTIFGKNKDISLKKLQQLRDLGCYVALDDFGTGYSSITHLKDTPCTAVKVDKSFVDKVTDNDDDQAIIHALLGLGESMGFKLVLEGVETAGQAEILKTLGCKIAQGFLYAKPMPAQDVPLYIAQLKSKAQQQVAAE